MTLRIPAKVLIHVCSYDFYDMTLSTGKQRRHMINKINISVFPKSGIRYFHGPGSCAVFFQGYARCSLCHCSHVQDGELGNVNLDYLDFFGAILDL